MADEEHLAILWQGIETWNTWREEHPEVCPDFTTARLIGNHLDGARLDGADLFGADLYGAHLARADLVGADLTNANLADADLTGSTLARAKLVSANLARADLAGADLTDARLGRASLNGAHLKAVNFEGAILGETSFGDVDLSGCEGLETCRHNGPSIIDIGTLRRSGPLPLAFQRGVGLPEALIDYLPSLLNQPIQLYSCFISYSSADEAFTKRLHADLQAKGVRCWFAPHDMPIGAKILDAIDEAIRLRDKVLLILSEHAIASDWVEGEVTRGLDEERERKRVVLFPIRVDAAVMETARPWARLLRGQRNIGDFTRWKEHDAYAKALDRLLRDLRVEKA
jgi:uncharacterized protein YjbI with pentapeptide repeats